MTRFRKQTWFALGFLILLALLLRFNVRQGRVSGPSMEPTYHNGETVLVWKSVPRSSLKPGNVIIFRDTNGDELIKRIAFIRPIWKSAPPSGDFVTVNGAREIPYSVLFGLYFQSFTLGKVSIPPPDHIIFVLGDNLRESDDSRRIGPISYAQVLGKVVP
jgi:signal peptidase I